ncbi:alpha/beta hydrolase [Flavobacterium aquidurense]|uniref:Lysophospholipase-like protein n=1 Tax=Flavobacterium aquidurense TaxID=362413 RepID=A0A0Q0VV95_9FLAO|nr:alpha/beta hydrolase [Flavobacterium aquidurense]KQB37737.1 Lysophospholipase-like protein [Flavobacterium aquidurense]
MKVFKNRRNFILIVAIIFIIINIIAFIHAYKFTHFAENGSIKTKSPERLSSFEKTKTLIFGVNNPKPKNTKFPLQKYQTIKLKSNKKIECWLIKNQKSKGTIILFHGYGAEKSSMIDKSNEFIKLGFSTILVDFMGSGNSEGNQTTIGYKEAQEVKSVFDYLTQSGEKNIYLFGTSMGAVAIMKSITDYKIKPKGIIIECPFGSMYETVCARFNKMNVPNFPMAGILVFWGGIQNGFWGFSHNPATFAKNITCPTLLLYGEKDKSVTRKETDEIYSNLNGYKKLVIYKNTGHENYLIKNKIEWTKNVSDFLTK